MKLRRTVLAELSVLMLQQLALKLSLGFKRIECCLQSD